MHPDDYHPRMASLVMVILFGLGGVWLLASPWAPARSNLQVTTTVLLRSQIEQMVYPTYLTPAPEDIQRGWVEPPAGSQLTVYNNCRAGYRLVFETVDAPWLDRFLVRVRGTEIWMPAAGGSLLLPWEGTGRKALELHYRFELRTGTTPGIYPWPLRLSVLPAVTEP